MLLLKSPPRHAVDFLLLTVFIIQQSGYKMAVGARQTFCNCLIKQDNGNAPRERQWPTGTNGARSSMMAQLLSKSFILLYSKVKAKLRWEATWQHLATAQAKIQSRAALSQPFHCRERSSSPMWAETLFWEPHGLRTTHWHWLSHCNLNHILPLKVQTPMFSITAPGTSQSSAQLWQHLQHNQQMNT